MLIVKEDCFEYEFRDVPENIPEGTVLGRALFLSMDPTHILWTKLIPQYMPAVGLGTVMRCIQVCEVVKTTDPEKFPIGSAFNSVGGVAEYTLYPVSRCSPVVPNVPLSWNIGPYSVIQGLTAWVGYKICDPKAGETMVISGASGSVGSLAGQLAKTTGARVIGIAGGSEKCKEVVEVFGFDGCIDYKSESVASGLKRLCPNGVDSFFDNVGGDTLEAVLDQVNCFSRVAFCGAISTYDKIGQRASGIKNFEMILMRRVTVQGFICSDHLPALPEAMKDIGNLHTDGKLVQKEDIREAKIEDYVSVVNNLFTGGNKGKLIMKII